MRLVAGGGAARQCRDEAARASVGVALAAAAALGSALTAGLALAGCRATAESATMDMAQPRDMATPDLSASPPPDMAMPPDLAVCPHASTEICHDGCDNDDNGYIDEDDPSCSSQMLVTFTAPGSGGPTGSSGLWRLILGSPSKIEVLDGNPVMPGAMATYDRAFSPAFYIDNEEGRSIELRRPDAGSTTVNSAYTTRDVCVFNGELIVVAVGTTTSTLHRYQPDAMTELMPTATVPGAASACSSDGNRLYVPFYVGSQPSRIQVYAKPATAGGAPQPAGVLSIPQPLTEGGCGGGCDRLLDMVWLKHSGAFVGLFANSQGMADSLIYEANLMAQFDFDGGVGEPIPSVLDGGGLFHGVGEFLP